MINAIKLWNESNNLPHWDFQIDTDWKEFAHMARLAAHAIHEKCTNMTVALMNNATTEQESLHAAEAVRERSAGA